MVSIIVSLCLIIYKFGVISVGITLLAITSAVALIGCSASVAYVLVMIAYLLILTTLWVLMNLWISLLAALHFITHMLMAECEHALLSISLTLTVAIDATMCASYSYVTYCAS